MPECHWCGQYVSEPVWYEDWMFCSNRCISEWRNSEEGQWEQRAAKADQRAREREVRRREAFLKTQSGQLYIEAGKQIKNLEASKKNAVKPMRLILTLFWVAINALCVLKGAWLFMLLVTLVPLCATVRCSIDNYFDARLDKASRLWIIMTLEPLIIIGCLMWGKDICGWVPIIAYIVHGMFFIIFTFVKPTWVEDLCGS